MSLFRRRKVAESAEPAEDATGGVTGGSESVTTAESGAEPATAAHGVVDDPEARAAAEAVSEAVSGTSGNPADPAVEESDPFDRSQGPWDVSEVGEDEGRLALGGLQLVGREGMELRFEVEEAGGRVIAVTVGLNGSTVQLQAFAAPRTAGVWDEIRHEIAEAVVAQGGSADVQDGALGRELLCRLPVRTEDGRTAHQPTRFAGVDGPRWFLRAVFAGPAAHDPAAAAELESVVRDTVVVRGSEAMAPRELIPLELPQQPDQAQPAPAADAAEGAADGGGREELKPFERGPEITEVR
ncbi:DUF3710 domain-containing protein [Kineococcus rhizosphaerae]|uniref:Uncharacterized protein DUF3710 n=1 Tax=Kineococcus rhizosphaerae TaxID=559628 RepID=A0A2T0RB69_9ACTN|nr:DUF3710 domain-containing protein [Kineococcus rhizosphaerae]PRY18399.1 uncharacterized protein DUF3710 [Kineococcus rhizosphaerae]